MSGNETPDIPGDPDGRRGLNVIFKGLNKCNSGCSFCCIGKSDGTVIAPEDFGLFAERLDRYIADQQVGHLTFTFHGGEPTLYGAKYLGQMCARVSTMAADVQFNMQSNLLSVPRTVRDVIKRYRIKVGTSIDPIGMDRLTKGGRRTFDKWLDTFLDYSREIDQPGAILVVTRNVLGRTERIYDICESIGSLVGQRFALQVNPIYAQGLASDREHELGITPSEFGEFLVELWRLWEQRRRSISLVPIQSFTRHFLSGDDKADAHLSCSFNGRCQATHVGVDFRLNVAGCGRRLDSGAFLGNLRSQSLEDILGTHPERTLVAGRSELLRLGSCRDCAHFDICHGGCPDDAWLACGDIAAKSQWCDSHKMLFQAMERDIQTVRKPASRPPFVARRESDMTQIVLAGGLDAMPAAVDRRTEVWVLPDRDGRWLRFDSGFALPKGGGRTRLWCHNHQASSLMMWDDLLQADGTAIVLFEAEGLERAMNVLNALGALVILDVVAVTRAPTGVEALQRLVERFTGDPLWHSQILPFTQMIANYVEDNPIQAQTEFGLVPGQYRVVSPETVDSAHQDILDRLNEGAQVKAARWLNGRNPCLSCQHFRFCSARFAPGNGRECPPEVKAIVSRLKATADQMGLILREEMARRPKA